MPKFGSSFTEGFDPEMRPSAKGPSANVIRVGTGPPAPCVTEYIFQPPPMLAEIFAVARPPAGTLAGATVIERETGDCAAAAKEHTATMQIEKNEIESLDLKVRILRCKGDALPKL
jgi:hypothetical protein